MTTSIHDLISRFLQQQSVMALPPAPVADSEGFTKAGVVPFYRESDGQFRFYVMKPTASVPSLGVPPFQLCKGTRMQLVPGVGWRDIRERGSRSEQKETLVQTALREGEEELGLVLDNIRRLYDLGPYGFSSATTGKDKQMWLFAAEVERADHFLTAAFVAQTTADRAWQTLAEFSLTGRADHRYILADIETRLAAVAP